MNPSCLSGIDNSKTRRATLHPTPAAPPKEISPEHYLTKFRNPVMISAFVKSMKKAPTSGTVVVTAS